jgi:arylsulfatase A-like enzyme
VVFSRAYSQSSWTKPAVASLLTSQFPSMHQTNLERSRLPDAEVLLTEAVRDAGYATAVLSGNPWVAPEYGFDQGVDHFYSPSEDRFAPGTLLGAALESVGRPGDGAAGGSVGPTPDELLEGKAARWIGVNRDRRFFLYLHLMGPHPPYDPPRPYDTMFVPRPQDPPVTTHPRKSYFFGEEGEALSGPQLADLVGRYDGEIRFADMVVGRLIASLREMDLLDRTLVIVTADHGEEFYDHKNWGHGHSLYDELLRVPLVVRYPSRFPPGMRVAAPVMSVDVMPTILELINGRTGAPTAGRSLVALLGDPGANRPEAFAELIYGYGTARALVSGDKKLIEVAVGEDRRRDIYDLRADPQERWKVVPEEAPHLFERLAALTEWAERHRVDPVETRVTEAAKALGYLN